MNQFATKETHCYSFYDNGLLLEVYVKVWNFLLSFINDLDFEIVFFDFFTLFL